MPRFVFRNILVCLLMVFFSTAARGEEATSPTLVQESVLFQAAGGLQVEVWLNGSPAGVTPFRADLAPGEYLLTAATEAVEPIIESYTISGESGQVAYLPIIPLSQANYLPVRERVFAQLKKTPGHPHVVMMALFLSVDVEEKGVLLKRLDAFGLDHHSVHGLRARVLLDQEKVEEALAEAERSTVQAPQSAFGWRTLAMVLIQQGRLEEALQAANQAVLLEPRAWRNLRVRAVVFSKTGDDNAALNDGRYADELYREFQEKAPRSN